MSEFSNMLNSFIKEKNIKVYSLAKYCDLDRSTMYKLMRGTRRLASEETFRKIAEFLQLTPVEYELFLEAYRIAEIGEDIYYKRKSTESFLIDFPRCSLRTFSAPLPVQTNYSDSEEELYENAVHNASGCCSIPNQVELNCFIHHMISTEAQKKNGRIALLVQPDYGYLFNLLSSLRQPEALKLEHVFCLSRDNQMTTGHELYNLLYIKSILPLFISHADYHPYYYYEDIHSHFDSFNGFPCMILTSASAITCSSDYQTGIYFQDVSVVSMLWDLYHSYQNKCTPLFHVLDFLPANGRDFVKKLYQKAPGYILQPEACLMPFITRELQENVLSPDLPERDLFLKKIDDLLSSNKKQLDTGEIRVYFTKKGLTDFTKTGRIHEIPLAFCRAFTPEERGFLLNAMLPYCIRKDYRILKKPLNQLSEDLHLCVNSSYGYLLFNTLDCKTLCLIINEPGLLLTFCDYMETLSDSDFYTAEECVDFVQSEILRLKQEEV